MYYRLVFAEPAVDIRLVCLSGKATIYTAAPPIVDYHEEKRAKKVNQIHDRPALLDGNQLSILSAVQLPLCTKD